MICYIQSSRRQQVQAQTNAIDEPFNILLIISEFSRLTILLQRDSMSTNERQPTSKNKNKYQSCFVAFRFFVIVGYQQEAEYAMHRQVIRRLDDAKANEKHLQTKPTKRINQTRTIKQFKRLTCIESNVPIT